MRINTNISALNAHRQLGINTEQGTNAMERLSSGLRINRAGDDAAGLAISEKMRGQIRGLKQASRNAQDGISLIQTAEGALNETHAILQRMRELAVQSSTDTNTDDDRLEIQKEITQLTREVDRIARTTQFNTMELLDGSYGGKVFHIGANDTQSLAVDIANMRADALKIVGTEPTGAASSTDPTGSAGVGGTAASATVEVGTGNDVTITGGENSAYNGIKITFAVSESGEAPGTAVYDSGTNTITVTLNVDNSTDGIDAGYINTAIAGISADAPEGVEWDKITVQEGATAAASDWDGKTFELAGGVTEVEDTSTPEPGNTITGQTTVNNGTADFEVTVTAPEGSAYEGITITFATGDSAGAAYSEGTITVTLQAGEDYNAAAIQELIRNATGAPEGVDFNEFAVAAGTGFDKASGTQWAAADDITLGEGEKEPAAKEVFDESTLHGINVDTQEAADKAIEAIDEAIVMVSAERSKLGAMQNRLEHTIANLGTSAENLQAAESRIRDLDMAEEIMQFTKANILNQAATAMLAQANMAPQTVLQLLG